ncbi:MAG TPA: FtsQ-type POTRA domain-containing protein, partial [Candidatus Eisenbacteria bacterium]|nr:FtsQ-type POTRA domain-containing protein [Candidatus Eisenbacteria bacterium]
SLALAAVELAALVALLVAPVFQVRYVDVTGNRRLTAAQVVAAAGLQHPGSVFQVDPPALERRVAAATWVRTASASVQLPDRVGIRVDEWRPVAVYRAGGGRPWYLSDQAVALGPAGDADADALLDVDGPAQPEPRTGSAPMDRALLTALVNIQRSLPGLIGQDVQSFTIDSCGSLTLNSRKGWKAQFGRALTPEERATLRDKVAALEALAASGDVDFDTVQYVNVMNPAVVAVPRPTPARGGRASPSPAPTPAPAAPARPQPAPCR